MIFTLLIILVFSSKALNGQIQFLKTEDRYNFGRVSVFGGMTLAFDNSADDHYRLGLRLSLPWRFHIIADVGLRPVSPYTVIGVIGLERDVFQTNQQRVKVAVNHSYMRRVDHLLFDDRVRKTTIGLGAESMVFSRIGVGVDYMPVGFYHGTRKDNPEKGNPSTIGARELKMYLFYTF